MSKKTRRTLPVRQGFAVILAFLGFLSLFGALGFTSIGKSFYNFLKFPFGELVWVTPVLFFLIAFICWISIYFAPAKKSPAKESRSSQSVKTRTRNKETKRNRMQEDFSDENYLDKGVELPKGKLVPLKGFQEYFASDLEFKPMEPLVELEELGKDFSTYFRAGKEISFKPAGTRLATVEGFSEYFDEVSSEIEEELKNAAPEKAKDVSSIREKISLSKEREWDKSSIISHESDYYPGQVAQLLKDDHRLSKGVSPEERAVLLGKTSFTEEKSETQPSKVQMEKITPELKDLPTLREEIVVVKEIENQNLDNRDVNYIIDEAATAAEEEESAVFGEPVQESFDQDQLKQKDIAKESALSLSVPKDWHLPTFELLDPLPQIPVVHDQDTQKHLEKVLEDFGVQARVIRVARGPVITRYELAPAPGVKISRIVNLADDIALGLAARDVRIEAPIPGKSAIGIEVPNKHPRGVPFREVLETPEFREGSAKLRIALGKDIGNQSIVANLAKMPHLLVAGATGSGKSVCITAIINSLLFNTRPDEVKFLMIDPKMVELSIYNGIPHLLAPVVTEPKKASAALKWVVKEMETRYELFAASGVRDIERYNQIKASESGNDMPWIVVIIDELADLMMVAANEVEESICRLAQMARAAGIHLVIATQRPSVDVITGVIKANIPSRISFAVSSQIDSRTILDSTGAEKLLGRGDMLYSPQGINKPMRVQGCMVTDEEVQRVISHWKAQGYPEYLDPEGFTNAGTPEKGEGSGPDDELFIEAGRMIITTGMASVSYLQRKLKLGYARAARLIDMLEDEGVVGGYEGSKPRQILLTIEEFEERFGI